MAAKANLDHLNALKSFLTLVAPFDGVVTARNTDIGALIDAGVGQRDLFRVADIHAMRIYTSVPQAYAAKMTMGLSARLLLPQYPGREFEAKVIANANAIRSTRARCSCSCWRKIATGRCCRAPSGKSGSSCRRGRAALNSRERADFP